MSADDSKALEVQKKIYANMSPLQKLTEVAHLREAAWAMKYAGLKNQHPDWSHEKITAEVKKIFLYAST